MRSGSSVRSRLTVAAVIVWVWVLSPLAGCADEPSASGDDYVVNAAIWGSPEGDLFTVGYQGFRGFVKQLRSGRWDTVYEMEEWLRGIEGTSSTDYFAFGGIDSRLVLHHVGGTWNTWDLSTLWEPRTGRLVAGLWAAAPSEAFVAGERGFLARFDGSAWDTMELVSAADLLAIWGTSSSDVLAVGTGGTILRYNGVSWSQEASPTDAKLQGIWGSSPSDVFVIGETSPEQAHVILHYDGAAWSQVHDGPNTLLGIHGTAADCIYAVGGIRDGDAVRSGVLFFDGTAWTGRDGGTPQFLWDVWVQPACDAWAVGPNITLPHGL